MTIEADFNPRLPSAEPTDSDDVRWALETATAMWSNGDFHEALRWLRRAAESASEEGADMRAVQLAKLGAELRGHLALPTSIPPPPPAADADEQRFDHAAESLLRSESTAPSEWPRVADREATPEGSNGQAQSSPSRPFLNTQSGLGPDDDYEARTSAPSPSGAWPQPGGSAVLEAPQAFASEPPPGVEQPSSETPATAGARSDVAQVPLGNSPAPTAAVELEQPAREPFGFVSHQAIRVAITTSPERRGVLIAQVLETGERAPAGAKEALFVALEPGIELYV